MLKAKISSDSLLTAKRPNSSVFKTDLKRDHCVFLCVSGAVEDTAPHLCGNIWVNDSLNEVIQLLTSNTVPVCVCVLAVH